LESDILVPLALAALRVSSLPHTSLPHQPRALGGIIPALDPNQLNCPGARKRLRGWLEIRARETIKLRARQALKLRVPCKLALGD
jgi:hypothetical protein